MTTLQYVPPGGQRPEDIAQNEANARNPAIVAASAAVKALIEPGQRCGWSPAWQREWDAAVAAHHRAKHDAGDHRTCWPHECSVVAIRALAASAVGLMGGSEGR